MQTPKINAGQPPTVLVAPLDWGLGHATRCVPVVRELLAQGCNVVLAGSGAVKALLQAEFPQAPFVDLEGYNIHYAGAGWRLPFVLAAQVPKLLRTIHKEHRWLRKVAAEHKIDAVISDNRYGLWHPKIVSVFVTHQLRIQAPWRWTEAIIQRLNYRFVNRFNTCWVPDAEGEDNLAGELSHPDKKPLIPLRYVGPLSRFNGGGESEGKHLLIVLSGPEPQRTLLEQRLVSELKTYTGPVVFVRGLPGAKEALPVPPNVAVYNHLPAAQMEEVMRGASVVIGRCGYSTVMDVAALRKRSILIPTPGQTEQQYLAKHLTAKGFALCEAQKDFRLKDALKEAETFPYHHATVEHNRLEEVIQRLREAIQTNQRYVRK